MSPTRLDELSDHALLNILRYLSDKPSRKEWSQYVSTSDALMSIHPSCPLSRVAGSSFPHVNCAFDVPDGERNSTQPGMVNLEMGDSYSRMIEWLEHAGESVTSVRVDGDMYHAGIEGIPSLLQSLEVRAIALRCLDISNHLDITLLWSGLLRATGGRLEKLVANCRQQMEIEKHCRSLRVLKLSVIFSIRVSMLHALGPTLKNLGVSAWTWQGVPTGQQVRELCPNLSSVHLDVSSANDASLTEYAELLCSYGDRLRFADLRALSAALCERVCASCPNLRCTIGPKKLPEMMRAMGSSLKTIMWDWGDKIECKNLTSFAGSCNAIQSIYLREYPDNAARVLRGLLHSDNPLLTFLSLDVSGEGDVGPALRELGARAGTLRKLMYVGTVMTGHTLEAVARGAPLLERVEIELTEDEISRRPERVVRFTKAFLECPKLRYFYVHTQDWDEDRSVHLDEIAIACRRARFQRKFPLYVNLFEIEYLL